MEEYRETGWYGVECTSEGKFRRNGKPIKIRAPHHRHSATIVVRIGNNKTKEVNAKWLVARAWCPDYTEGCHVIHKNGDKNDVSLENLLIVSEKDFRKYQYRKSAESRWGGGTEEKEKEVFKPTFIPDVECSISGVFRKNGRRLKLEERQDILGRQRTLKLRASVDGVKRTFTAARVVAQTWSPTAWDEDCVIQYKDGNRLNIHSDNLILVNRDEYYKNVGQKLGTKKTEFEDAYRYVERAAKEAGIAYRYFQTGDFTELNEYVKTELFPNIYRHTSKYFGGRELVNEITTEVVGIMYEHVFANRPLFSYFNFCKRLVMIYYRKRDFGYYKHLPNPIVRKEVSQLKLESLCERFRETKIK